MLPGFYPHSNTKQFQKSLKMPRSRSSMSLVLDKFCEAWSRFGFTM